MNWTEIDGMDPNRFGAMLKLWKNNIPEECTTILFS